MSNQKQLNEKQVRILLAVANAGDAGLNKDEIKQVWGWDGSNIDYLRFTRDWEALCTERGKWSSDLIKGPLYKISAPRDEPGRYYLSYSGRDYLIDNKII